MLLNERPGVKFCLVQHQASDSLIVGNHPAWPF
jgi:hypothetical protein